ncbi:hypothetical protein OH76DRAFT_1481169 [Lentinus brumalis]|uniref:Peptidase C14 caspase domain-containing protein n=1 Tax=Lentinus brumalis TaxID=2498619 RepID=A0A371DGH2_9APHY|nr:hypothetical protein OH76DRAFT_1481169 [Polyporus brumalis]
MVKIGRRRSSTPLRKALLVGIGYVDAASPDFPPLSHAHSDTEALRDLLINNYDYSPEDVTVMSDKDGIGRDLGPTRENVLKQLGKPVVGAQSGSRAMFSFSGHSGQVPDPKNREADGLDEYIVPVDHVQLANDGTGKPTKKVLILDNTLRKKLVNPLPIGASLTAIFDSCHSGTMLDLDHYLCNSYHPWTDIAFRRHLTKWLGVRRKDGQRLSQAGVKAVTRRAKRVHHDVKEKGKASATTTPSREGSGCSVRIYQRKRLSNDQMETIDVAATVTVLHELQQSAFSVQCKPSASISQILEGDGSVDSLADNDVDIPRCALSVDMECAGFCPYDSDGGGTPD